MRAKTRTPADKYRPRKWKKNSRRFRGRQRSSKARRERRRREQRLTAQGEGHSEDMVGKRPMEEEERSESGRSTEEKERSMRERLDEESDTEWVPDRERVVIIGSSSASNTEAAQPEAQHRRVVMRESEDTSQVADVQTGCEQKQATVVHTRGTVQCFRGGAHLGRGAGRLITRALVVADNELEIEVRAPSEPLE